MDFLDPRKRRHRKAQLLVGYGLVAIAIGFASVILVYGAYGYGINTKTGDVIQNGLLFVDSKPGGADIYLNSKSQHSTTSARLVLPAGTYNLALKKTAYYDWQRTFTLPEHAIARYVYPFLYPLKPTSITLKVYSAAPPLTTESLDRKWLLVQLPTTSGTVIFDEYDLGNLAALNNVLTLPASLLTTANQAGSSLSVVEWASDNRHVLLKHDYPGGPEFIIFDRQDPTKSLNLNKLLSINPSQVALKNKKIDQLYVYDQPSIILSVADVAKATVTPLLKQVLAFKSSGSDLISYITDQGASTGQLVARIWEAGKSYSFNTFSSGATYLLDEAQFQDHWYYVAGSDTATRINIYKDPLSGLKDPAISKAVPLLSLRGQGASQLSFSTNARFISLQAGSKFAVYDLETQTNYQYSLAESLEGPMHWMDGHRLIGQSAGQVLAMDYDATNKHLLVPTVNNDGGYFDSSYNHLITTAQVPGSDSVALNSVDLRAGADLPR